MTAEPTHASAATIRRVVHRLMPQEQILLGIPANEAIARLAQDRRLKRVFLVSSKSVSRTGLLGSIKESLGERCAGVFTRVTPHAQRECVVEGAAELRAARADAIVAVGGGSVIDAAKVMQLCLWANVGTIADMDRISGSAGARIVSTTVQPRVIAVPTTLSGAEFTAFAGATDTRTSRKEAYEHPFMVPMCVVLDPDALAQTPKELVVMTGVRAIDHCVETFCSSQPSPYFDALAASGLKVLLRALVEVTEGVATPQTYSELQTAAWMAIAGVAAGIPVGASHAIGRVLGAIANVPHGHTSALLLPAVLRWNAAAPAARARQIELLRSVGIDSDELARTIQDALHRMRQPTRLAQAGLKREQLATIAEYAIPMLAHHSTRGNARPIESAAQVAEILELAW